MQNHIDQQGLAIRRETIIMSCQRCGKPACITITGVGRFCVDCHNAWVEEEYGISDKFDYPKDIMIFDPIADKLVCRLIHL